MGEIDATVVMAFLLGLIMMALGIATVYQAATANPVDKPNIGFGSVYLAAFAAIMWGVLNVMTN